jgi:hypothetical protein
MSIKSWTWFDEELDAISSLASSRPSLDSSTLTNSLAVSQQNLVAANGFLICSSPTIRETSEGKESHVIKSNRLRNLVYRGEYSDEVMSLTEVSRPSYDLGYHSQSKSEGGLNVYDDVPSPPSGAILDIDLMMSDGSCEQFPSLRLHSGLRKSTVPLECHDIQDPDRLSLSEPDEEIYGSHNELEGNFARGDHRDSTFSFDSPETAPSFLKTFGHGSSDLYGRIYFGSEMDLEVGISTHPGDIEVVVSV